MKKTSLDPNVAVSPEKHLFSAWSRKPGKNYTALPKLNNYTRICTGSSNKRETNILAVSRFKIPFERNAFRLNPFGTFR